MSYQLIITNVPMINGNKKTISIRCDDPLVLTWNKVFDFMEENKSIPRKFIACINEIGKYIYGKDEIYPDFNFNNLCLQEKDGKKTSVGLVNTSLVLCK
jgi:hypothetical protein